MHSITLFHLCHRFPVQSTTCHPVYTINSYWSLFPSSPSTENLDLLSCKLYIPISLLTPYSITTSLLHYLCFVYLFRESPSPNSSKTLWLKFLISMFLIRSILLGPLCIYRLLLPSPHPFCTISLPLCLPISALYLSVTYSAHAQISSEHYAPL